MNAPQDAPDSVEQRHDAEKWQEAKELLASLVEAKPRCIPVLVELARNLLEQESV